MMAAVSMSTIWLAVAMVPPAISFLMISAVFTPIVCDRSETLMAS